MCREDVTFYYGEMVQNEIVIRCGNITVDVTKCGETRARWPRRLFHNPKKKCNITVRTLTKIKSLCPECHALSEDHPFYLAHLRAGNLQTPHFIHSPPPSPTSALNARARAATMPMQHLQQHFTAPTRPSTSYQPYRHGTSTYQPTSHSATFQRQQQIGRSLTNPGLQHSPASHRPSSRAQSSRTR